MTPRSSLAAFAGILFLTTPGLSQWDPANGDWKKSDAEDVRVMTWNVEDGIRTEIPKTEGINQWHAIVVIVAAMQPDVLILQETGDNGCFNCVDTQAELGTVMDLFFNGGNDPFLGGAVNSYVQKYVPGYDLPHVYVTFRTDSFNRNIILSRFPFADLNGDTVSQYGDIPFVLSDQYAPGGQGGIRGFQFVEIDMPDGTYAGDLVVGNCHLKAGGSASDATQRREAAQNTAYVIDYWYNGGGAGIPDPNNKISDVPAATQILDVNTPVIWGGDWNQEHGGGCPDSPSRWFTQAQSCGGTDGTDRDRSDSTFDTAVHPLDAGITNTTSSSKLDYLARQDSIAGLRREFIFESQFNGVTLSNIPPELLNFHAVVPWVASSWSSDHRPVIADYSLPLLGPVNYCTSGTSASGCNPLISASGTASASASSGFTLSAATVEGSKDGLFFYGTSGRQANTWGSGTSYQCVVPPTKRGGLLIGTGTAGVCDGSFAQDLNARWCPTCPKPNHNPGAGAVMQGQLWYRDPLNTSNQTTSLSDAIEFGVGL